MSMEVVNAVGRRKAAVARVYVKPGKGNITINQKPLDTYFPLEIFQYVVKQPLLVTSTTENYDITITLDGGGIKGQAEAARLGIARALCAIDAEMRPVLKKNGFMTRDPREVERKKPGQPGARRKFQFSKWVQISETAILVALLGYCPSAENRGDCQGHYRCD